MLPTYPWHREKLSPSLSSPCLNSLSLSLSLFSPCFEPEKERQRRKKMKKKKRRKKWLWRLEFEGLVSLERRGCQGDFKRTFEEEFEGHSSSLLFEPLRRGKYKTRISSFKCFYGIRRSWKWFLHGFISFLGLSWRFKRATHFLLARTQEVGDSIGKKGDLSPFPLLSILEAY